METNPKYKLLRKVWLLNQSNGNWSKECQKVFETIKTLASREILLSYQNFNEQFDIHTDASKTQLESLISQKAKPTMFYSRNLNPARVNYFPTICALFSIVEALKEFRNT